MFIYKERKEESIQQTLRARKEKGRETSFFLLLVKKTAFNMI